MSEFTRILSQLESGDAAASAELLPLVYDELRQLAAVRMAAEGPEQTLQATALVHEAYLRLVGTNDRQNWSGRGHFFAAAAEAMRRILIEHARRKQADKRGGAELRRHPLDEGMAVSLESPAELLELDEALERLQATDHESAKLVKLRVFAGLAPDEAASALGLSSRTAARRWAYARAWLIREIEGRTSDTADGTKT